MASEELGHAQALAHANEDYPVDLDNVQRDQGLAQCAVRVHKQQQDWPAGPFCANCRSPWPCKLYRWGRAVLLAAGGSGTEIEACARSTDPLSQVPPARRKG